MNQYDEKQELINLFNEIGNEAKVITAWSEYGHMIISKSDDVYNLSIYEDSKVVYIQLFSDIDDLSYMKELKSDDYKFCDLHSVFASDVHAYNTIKSAVLKNNYFDIKVDNKGIYWNYSDWDHTITVYKDGKLVSNQIFSDIDYDTEIFSSGLEGEFEVVYNIFKKICGEIKINFKISK